MSRRSGGSSVHYTWDAQGSLAQRLDGAGAVLTSHLYDAFGAESASGSTTDPYRYGGQWGYYADGETGLCLLTHRYCDPGTGRFLNRDPIGYAGGVNVYGYVDSNPATRADPSGLVTIRYDYPLPGEGRPFHHVWIQFRPGPRNNPCAFAQSFGLWAIGEITFIDSPDGSDPRKSGRDMPGWIGRRNNDPKFEKNLCTCIMQAMNKPAPPMKGVFYNCSHWTNDMWDCASVATYGPVEPSLYMPF